MARARTIKPSFFVNELLGTCSPFARLLFIGLWTIADKEGLLEDRPIRIKAQLMPYDDVDVDALLEELVIHNFLTRYVEESSSVIYIHNFHMHQNPHPKEASSNLPELTEKSLIREKQLKEIKLNEKQFKGSPCIGNRKEKKEKKKEGKDRAESEPVDKFYKIQIGSHFAATECAIAKLRVEDGDAEFDSRVETINDYCAAKGVKYKDYPAAYRNFRKRDRETGRALIARKAPQETATSRNFKMIEEMFKAKGESHE